MTNDDIDELLDEINSNSVKRRIFISGLTGRVDYARVWLEEPRGGIVGEGSYSFCFIKN